LPDPAPATISTGPSTQLTAFFCSLFSPSKIALLPFSITDAKIDKTLQLPRTFFKNSDDVEKDAFYFVKWEKILNFAGAF
jgi:hypothetical protein